MEPADTLRTVGQFIARAVLPSPDTIKCTLSSDLPHIIPDDVVVITPDALNLVKSNQHVDWLQFDRLRTHYERGRTSGYLNYLQCFSAVVEAPLSNVGDSSSRNPSHLAPINVLFSYKKISRGYETRDFVQYFTQRYHFLERLLRVRPELQGTISIGRVLKKQAKEHVSIIGIVSDKNETKNGNIMLTVEDPTGRINVLVNKGKPDLFNSARDIVHDEVIGVVGVCGERILFANNILWPDVPFNKELKKAPDEAYAIFLSDVHVGSKKFLAKEFQKFLKWISGTKGTDEQKAIARKVRYVFIVGDLVDGVGIYPDQDKELEIKDIYGQYAEFARLISEIPPSIQIILCPGNHDALRLSEPQPPLDPDFARPLYGLPNVTLVSNPALVNIHAQDGFSGFDVLMYHGYSFDYYVANVDSIRSNGGYHRADLIMKFLLKRRHLAPTHASTLHIPDTETDPLVITKVPDIFVTGHIHYSLVANYRSVTMISGSCWQGITSFQEKLGHEPEPARIPVVNLKTRQVKILKFI